MSRIINVHKQVYTGTDVLNTTSTLFWTATQIALDAATEDVLIEVQYTGGNAHNVNGGYGGSEILGQYASDGVPSGWTQFMDSGVMVGYSDPSSSQSPTGTQTIDGAMITTFMENYPTQTLDLRFYGRAIHGTFSLNQNATVDGRMSIIVTELSSS